uniref:DNA/RNA-binding domain-containing protein n=1 Tax=Globisporangium ultimum (strain ATCC 200006 / CBS 805.95 / DAOM BR144) TaxID=431595 RepID=K3W6K6_GLOUD
MEDAKRKLQSVLVSCAEFYTRLVAELHALDQHLQSGLQKPGTERQAAIRFSLHMCLVALGDTARYTQKVSPSSQSRRGHHHDWSIAQQFYQRALEFLPSNGKVYNQLALLAISQRQVLTSVYLYARSLACERPFSSRENFVHAVHRGKATNAALRIRCRSIAEVQTHVAALFLSCLDIVLTGIEQDRWHTTTDVTLSGLKYFLGACTSTLLARKQLDLASIQKGLDQIVCLLIFALHHVLESAT